MNYDTLRKQTNTGWNTWFSSSMTSHVLLPYGFCIHLCFKTFSEVRVLRNLKPDDHGLRPGNRSWDGTYTSLSFQAGETKITVESAAAASITGAVCWAILRLRRRKTDNTRFKTIAAATRLDRGCLISVYACFNA